MKKITEEEYEEAWPKPAAIFIKPILREANDMFKEDKNLMFVEVTPDDLPEEQRYRFESGSEGLQRLAGLFRMRITPLDDIQVSVRNGRLFLKRRHKPVSANKIKE